MSRRVKTKLDQPVKQETFDEYFSGKSLKAIKKPNGEVVKTSGQKFLTIEELLTPRKEENEIVVQNEKKFCCIDYFKETSENEGMIGEKTKEVLSRMIPNDGKEKENDRTESERNTLIRLLARNLCISQAYGWDKKYRPAFQDEVG